MVKLHIQLGRICIFYVLIFLTSSLILFENYFRPFYFVFNNYTKLDSVWHESDSVPTNFSPRQTFVWVMSENIVMHKIAHLCTVLRTIFTTSVRNSYLLTKYKIKDVKIMLDFCI